MPRCFLYIYSQPCGTLPLKPLVTGSYPGFSVFTGIARIEEGPDKDGSLKGPLWFFHLFPALCCISLALSSPSAYSPGRTPSYFSECARGHDSNDHPAHTAASNGLGILNVPGTKVPTLFFCFLCSTETALLSCGLCHGQGLCTFFGAACV